MKMSRTQTRFFLDKLLLFYNAAELTRMLSVSRPTMDRWIADENRPTLRYLPLFKEAYQGLIERLDAYGKKHGKWARDFADILDELEYPATSITTIPDNQSDAVRRWLHRKLSEGPKRTTVIYKEAAELEFTKAQVLHAARKLDVAKDQKSAGRGSYSVWRLP